MKIFSTLSKIFLFFCFTIILHAFNAGSTINGTLLAPYVETPTIDGELDSTWTFPDVGMFALIDSNPPMGAEDLSAWFKLGWDNKGLYLFVHVVDDSIDTSPVNSWESDCIEIFLDGGNEKDDELDDNDVQWRWVALEDTMVFCSVPPGANLRPADYELAWTQDTGVGYNLELAIPEAGLEKLGTSLGIDLSEWSKIGFDLQVTDNDSTKSNDGIRWHATGGDDYAHPAAWGTVQLGGTNDTLQIPWAYSSPEIDGYLDDDWFDNEIPEISMTAITEGNYPPDYPEGAAPDFSTFFRAAWNGDGFYLFGRVVDDSIQVENEVTDDNEWQQDCWEIYLDGENEKSGDYDKNDVYYRFVYGLDTATQGPMDGFDIAWVQTDDGYTFELGIPVATLEDTNISLHGQIIGFEVQCTDNDGNGHY
jgi:endo-1,4-beta-xylanase